MLRYTAFSEKRNSVTPPPPTPLIIVVCEENHIFLYVLKKKILIYETKITSLIGHFALKDVRWGGGGRIILGRRPKVTIYLVIFMAKIVMKVLNSRI